MLIKQFLNFRCVPVPGNEICGTVIESYAIDVAQVKLNTIIVNSLESARSAVLESDIDPSCITILDWIICLYRLPPCFGTKLLFPCIETCEELLGFLVTCYGDIEVHIDDNAVRRHFTGYRCRLAESYYDGYDWDHFVANLTTCINAPLG